MQNYKVQLDTYSGPMDLLLYLIRRDEVDIYDIPISRVLEQYLEFVRMLENLDPDAVGEFLVLAATLMEIKSRMLLPKPPPEVAEDDGFDPRADLVRQLLAYKSFRDAAGSLRERADTHAQRFPRPRISLPDEEPEVDLEDVQIWDLLTAFNKLLASVGKTRAVHEVVYDDTPITLHAEDVLDRLQREGPAMPFERIFEGRRRGEMIGLFLALLELIRQKRVRVDQPEPMSSIMVHLIDPTPITTILDTDAEPPALSEEEEEEPEPVGPQFREAAGQGELDEPLFEDEEEEEDEFTRQINAVQVSDVNLRWSGDTDEDADAGDDAESEGDQQP